MNWERMKEQLEEILQTTLQFEKMTYPQWNKGIRNAGDEGTRLSLQTDQKLYFFLYREGSTVQTLSIDAAFATPAERKLLEMTIAASQSPPAHPSSSSGGVDEEGRAIALHDWIQSQLENGVQTKELPEFFSAWSAMHFNRIPLLMYSDSSHRKIDYTELRKLLETFFDDVTLLIPITDREWLILAPETLIMDSGEEGIEGEESLEEALASICFGLYEMMANEWIGECHLSVTYPMVPANSLLSSLVQLRESVHLGRTFHLDQNIHLPWQLYLDKLLQSVPEQEKSIFLERILKRMDVFDSEMLYTLEQFFEMDCNVSESAKELFIHRNTLLYRLDKFRQETGMDVRAFNQAVLVKIALQLYKVTKRK